jgi:predicted transcriptional regulator
MLRAIKSGAGFPEEIAKDTGLPIFRVRSGLRELTQAGLVELKSDNYVLTENGSELIE